VVEKGEPENFLHNVYFQWIFTVFCVNLDNLYHLFFTTIFIDSKEEVDKKIQSFNPLSCLPNEWTIFQLSREQRLKLYEQAVQVNS